MPKEKIVRSLVSLKKELNPKIWTGDKEPKLFPEIRKKLLEVTYEFLDMLENEIFIDDVVLIGSMAGYNWSEYSDMDIHIIVDMEQFDDPGTKEEALGLNAYRFNTIQNITIKGYECEVYIQALDKDYRSSGAYSLMTDEWLKIPEKSNKWIDKDLLKKKISGWEKNIENLLDGTPSIDEVKRLFDRLKKYRKTGLESGGELSYENLVFKYLRRSDHIKDLIETKSKLIDNKLSLENVNEQHSIFTGVAQLLVKLFAINGTPTTKEQKFIGELEDLIRSNRTIQAGTGVLTYDKNINTVQEILKMLGYKIEVDGKFGNNTKNFLLHFQKATSIPATGAVDKDTLKMLVRKLSEKGLDVDEVDVEEKSVPTLGGTNEEQIANFLLNRKLPVHVVAGILGNLYQESTLNPKAVGDNGHSLGIAQWNKSRKRDLENWCKRNKLDYLSLAGQLEYLWHDLTKNYPGVYKQLLATKTVVEATKTFMDKYERPGVPHYEKRLKYAQKAYLSMTKKQQQAVQTG